MRKKRKLGRKILLVLVLTPLCVSTYFNLSGMYFDVQTPVLEAPQVVETEALPQPAAEPVAAIEESPSPEVVVHKVRSGETLSGIWKKYTQADTNRGSLHAAAAFKKAGISLSSIRKGEDLELQLSSEGDITGLRKDLAEGRVLLLDGNSVDGYVHTLVTPKVVTQERKVSGRITTSLFESAKEQEIPYEVIDEFVDLFSGRIEFRRQVRRGDTFVIHYTERETEDGKKLPAGKIKAASFKNMGTLSAAVLYEGKSGKSHYYDLDGKPIGNYFLRYPVKFSRISSHFSKSRFHPVLKRNRPHNGVDFAAPTGTPVRSVADGVITYAGYNRGAGKMVKISHGSRYATAYLHLSRISKGISKGKKVGRGQVIGAVGMTGLATGPHLHYSFYDHGRYVDPLKIKLPSVPSKYDPIPKEFLQTAIGFLQGAHDDIEYTVAQKSSEPNVG